MSTSIPSLVEGTLSAPTKVHLTNRIVEDERCFSTISCGRFRDAIEFEFVCFLLALIMASPAAATTNIESPDNQQNLASLNPTKSTSTGANIVLIGAPGSGSDLRGNFPEGKFESLSVV